MTKSKSKLDQQVDEALSTEGGQNLFMLFGTGLACLGVLGLLAAFDAITRS